MHTMLVFLYSFPTEKLHYGVRGIANELFTSYLTGLFFCVKSSASYTQIKYRVSQGSLLGPLLFLITLQ